MTSETLSTETSEDRTDRVSFCEFLARKIVRYDPYSSSLKDHYVLGETLGRGAYGEVCAAKLRPRTRLFSTFCLNCRYTKSHVAHIVEAPDLDELMDAFRTKNAPEFFCEEAINPPTTLQLEKRGSHVPRLSAVFPSVEEENPPPSRRFSTNLLSNIGPMLSRRRVSQTLAGAFPRMSQMLSPAPLPCAQSFVTSELFVRRICSYDDTAFRSRPSPNDTVRRMASRAVKKDNLSSRPQSGVNEWCFAVKSLKKDSFFQEQNRLLQQVERRIDTVQGLLTTKTRGSVLVGGLGFRDNNSRKPVPRPPRLKRAQSRGSMLMRVPLAAEDTEMLKIGHYGGDQKMYHTGLEIELRELNKKRKALAADLSSDVKSVPESEVLKEVKLLALCRHKHILYLIECFEEPKLLSIVVERCYGDFASRYGNSSCQVFPETAVICQVVFQLLQAVEHIHRLFVVHRDIKPENILFKSPPPEEGFALDNLPDIVLGDFGLAEQLQHRGSVCKDVSGSAAFLSPESWSNNSQQSFKSDIWAVGVCMYEMTFAVLPYHASSHPELEGVKPALLFCDLAYKLGSVGIQLALAVTSKEAKPAFPERRDALLGFTKDLGFKRVCDEVVSSDLVSCISGMLRKDVSDRKNATQCRAEPFFRTQLDAIKLVSRKR